MIGFRHSTWRHDLETPVVDVTLFEDRARIVRVGRASLSQGEARVRLEGVSPVLADMTLSVSVEGHGARVVDACVRRRIVTRPTGDDRLDELEKECERLDAELARSGGRLELLKEEAVSYAELASLSLDEIAEEVAWDRGDATAWSERLDQLRERERDVVRRLVELSAERSESQRTRARVAQRMAAPANRRGTSGRPSRSTSASTPRQSTRSASSTSCRAPAGARITRRSSSRTTPAVRASSSAPTRRVAEHRRGVARGAVAFLDRAALARHRPAASSE